MASKEVHDEQRMPSEHDDSLEDNQASPPHDSALQTQLQTNGGASNRTYAGVLKNSLSNVDNGNKKLSQDLHVHSSGNDDFPSNNHQSSGSVQSSKNSPATTGNINTSYQQGLQTGQQLQSERIVLSEKRCSQNTEVIFYLYVENFQVDEAHIHFSSSESPTPLHRVDGKSPVKLWTRVHTIKGDSEKLIRYRYSISGIGSGSSASENPLIEQENRYLVVDHTKSESRVQYDVFHFDGDKKYHSETVPRAILMYTKWLFPSVNRGNIKKILTQVEKMSFASADLKVVKQFIEWILVETVDNPHVKNVQCLYLCVILGHLAGNYKTRALPLEDDQRTKNSFDRLLHGLETCADRQLMPRNSLRQFIAIAHVLVKKSSYPGWLTFAAHFYPYLGMEVLREKNTMGRYGKGEYHRMVRLLLSHLTCHVREKSGHELLWRMLEEAPDQESVLELFENEVVTKFLGNEEDKEDFFAQFYEGSWQSSGTTPHEIMNIPENLRYIMPGLVSKCLMTFAKSDDASQEKDIDAFFQLLASYEHLQPKQVHAILIQLSRSKSAAHRDLLPKLLNLNMFEQVWRGISKEQKVAICSIWITTKAVEERLNREDTERTIMVYRATQAIMSCLLNVSNKDLGEAVCCSVSGWLLKNVNHRSILIGCERIENYSPVIRECYKNQVKTILEQKPNWIRDNSAVLEQWSQSQSSFGQSLLLLALDVLDIPDGKKNNDEGFFKKMLGWCDTWKSLSSTKGRCEGHHNFKAGKNAWQELETCIREGNISLDLLKDLTKHQHKLSVIFTNLRAKPKADKEDESSRQQVLDRISELVKKENDFSENLRLLESVINFEIEVTEGSRPVEMPQVLQEFKKRRNNWGTMKVSELNDDEFWGPLFPLLEQAYTLKPLMKSMSFTSVAKTCLQDEQDSPSDESAEYIPRDPYAVTKLLTSEGISKFEAEWNSVFNNPGSLTLEMMKTLLGNLNSEEKLANEISILRQYFKSLPPHVKGYMEDYVNYPKVLKQVNDVMGVLDVFGLNDQKSNIVSTLTRFHKKFKDGEEIALQSLGKEMASVREILSNYIEETHGVMEELGRSRELHAFVEETVDGFKDIRLLIDAVEEHSDQFVSESLVSELIDVHRFLSPLIKKCQERFPPELILTEVVSQSKKHESVAAKIHQCSRNVNSLRGLYYSVGNRGELTKQIIANGLKKGVYTVSLENDGSCEAKMSYTNGTNAEKNSTTYSLPNLHDLRSRAHLIVSSGKNSKKMASGNSEKDVQDINFADFIEQVNLLTEITELLSKLRSSGYVKYRSGHWKNIKSTKNLEDMKKQLRKELEEWEESLLDARQKYYFLNYYRSDQLCILYDFLTNPSQPDYDEVLSLIHFVDPKIETGYLQMYREMYQTNKPSDTSDNPHKMVLTIGEALEEIFANTSPAVRPILDDGDKDALSSRSSTLDATVKSGELFVASLEEESSLTVNVMLTLYENTSNAFPEPNQVVFCDPQTTWEEIRLVLHRCFAQTKTFGCESLFCIANVELLSNEVQFKMVDFIKRKQNSVGASETLRGKEDYRLALICRGGDHHHIVEEFAQHSHHIAGMSGPVLSQRLTFRWPEVKMITSTLPGLGKTEKIRREMLEKDMNVTTFSISGPLDQSRLIKRLKELKVKKYHCLHLDIGEVDDPLWLDTFLFRLIVTGMVSSGTQLYHLQTAHVYMEIANTLDHQLRESMVISKYFNRVHMKWRNYEDLIASTEITSDLQVVCHYFDVFDRAIIESTDVNFTGPTKVKPLPDHRCRELLDKYYSSDVVDITFTALNTFLGVLANQLLKFSRSTFFKIANLQSMLGERAQGVRTNLFQALLDVSKEFASRSMATCSSSNLQALSQEESAKALDKAVATSGVSAQHMVERVEGMIHWEESNHLLVVFHGAQSQAIAAVYRNMDRVPDNVANLLQSQVVGGKKKELEDFKDMSQNELLEKLKKIASTKPPQTSQRSMFTKYALTPDNILKMILIILRIRANVPVIIMGETGCGKTTLVKYLSEICQKEIYLKNFHAGVTEDEVKEFIMEMQNKARKSREQIWVFLDEINTCDHLGMISDIMCHHALLGRPLPKNLVFLAACNPYKLRPKEQITTTGLPGKNTTDEYSRLVYRVYPLPEAMIDYVWDYGSLAPDDEKAYISRMVEMMPKGYRGVFVELLTESQKFIRRAENNPFCVSLRDVHRCIRLAQWFSKTIEKRQELNETFKSKPRLSNKEDECPEHLWKYHSLSRKYDQMPIVRSIVLALAHCYLSRLSKADLRRCYRERMAKLFSETGTVMTTREQVDSFSAIVRMEEEDFLDRMDLPSGTAKNAALRENVFVMLVSILNQIPVFVVGKPGCSKSLSMQVIRSNLRGRDSKDRLFQTFPQLYVVSYQGSESSTSEGIIKVFNKAKKYTSNTRNDVLPVVLLDEVGLAENSKHNPLKVLHSLLEPGDGKLPDVAVVGISNWALDAAKMNRAIHLSRPEPTKEDLYETGLSLHHADTKDQGDYDRSIGKDKLRCLAEAYYEYQINQKYANFHGLRDYYSLIKSLRFVEGSDWQQTLNAALQRNFGGIPGETSNTLKIFLEKLWQSTPLGCEDIIPVTTLIQKNIVDSRARHLMLITSGDSAVGILKQTLTKEKEVITIFGSRFEEDKSEDYNYRILSRIILCMERDCILILRNLERIYGSLYDMLNQNYAVVGKRKNCRVALGAYSNPMCQVNDGFRCIVITDQHDLVFSDPPFLNRFEKQLLRFSDVLDDKQLEIIQELYRWVRQISTVQGLESHFKESDMFVGFHEDTLPSLVLLHSHDEDESSEEIIDKCKEDLMWVATSDGVLRAQKCNRSKEDTQEINSLTEGYFEKPIHDGLASFMQVVMNDDEMAFFSGDEIGTKTIVMTYSTIHTDIPKCLGDTVSCQTERLSAYKSEKQLAERVDNFWSVSDKELLVLQCKPELDGQHMLIARSIIEDKRNSYEKACQDTGCVRQRKHVCIVVHLKREARISAVPWHFSFLCGWKQVFLDVLEAPSVPLNQIRTESVEKLLTSSIWPLRRIAENDLLWCFTCIKYTQRLRPLESILKITKNFFESDEVYHTIEKLVLQWVNANCSEQFERTDSDEPWQVKVACDRRALINSSTLSSAMEQHISRLVRQPLAKIIYFLEKENGWPPHLRDTSGGEDSQSEYEDMWCKLLMKESFCNISEIPEPQGAESYILDTVALDLHLPFSQVVIGRIDAVKDLVLEDYANVNENENNLDDSGRVTPNVRRQQIKRYSKIVANVVPEIHKFPVSCCNSYMADLFDLVSADFRETMSRELRVSIVKSAFLSYIKQCEEPNDTLSFYVQLHLFVWISKEQLLDQLRLVDSCQQFVRPQVLKILTHGLYVSNPDVFPLANSALLQVDETRDEIDSEDSMNESDATMLDLEQRQESIEIVKRNEEQYGSEMESPAPQQADANENNNNVALADEPNVEKFIAKEKDHKSTGMFEESEDEHSSTDASSSASTSMTPVSFQEPEPQDDAIVTSDAEMISGDFEAENEFTIDRSSDEGDESNEELQELFENVLVTKFCEEMLPSQQTVEERNGGLDSWIRNTSLLLSLASKISKQSPAFHFLRLCVDFAKIVLASSTPTEQSLNLLYILNEIASDLKPGYLDTDESLQKITELLIEPLKEQVKDGKDEYEALQKFSALLYGRCIDTNVDTSAVGPIVEHVLSLDKPNLVSLMRIVVLRLLLVEELVSPGIFVEIVTSPSRIQECPSLQSIDEVFKHLFAKGSINHDSYAAVMICDLVHSILHFDYTIDDLDSSDCKLLECARGAVKVLSGDEQDNCGLVLLSSVAFLRAFFTMLANYIAKNPDVSRANSSFSHVMVEINSLLVTCHTKKSLQIYLLKRLYQTNMSLFELCKLCQQSEKLPAIKSVFSCDTSVPKAEFVSVSKLPEYQGVKAAYWKLTNEDPKDMLKFLASCQNSPNHCLSLLGIFVNRIYLKRAERTLTDREECLVKWFSERSTQSQLPSRTREVLLRIISLKEFDNPQMQLSSESSVDEVETALLILHISCVLASGVRGENSPSYQYFSDPLKCKRTYILAHGEDRIHQAFEKRGHSNGPQPVTCDCGLRVMFKDNEDNRCPNCRMEPGNADPENNVSKTITNTPASKGYSPFPTQKLQWDACTESMNPSIYRALHLIVHACLYAGVVMGISSKNDLSSLINLEQVQSCISEKELRDPAEFCLNHIKADLECLTTILCCKKEITFKAMHLVVEKCTDLIRGDNLKKNGCSTPEQRLEWEVEFSNIAKEILQKAVGSARAIKEMTRMTTEENEASRLEDQIHELDGYPVEPLEQNQQLKRLFRVTRQPSLEEFQSTFLNSPTDLQDRHSFLTLFFAKLHEMSKIGYLYDLLRWARLVSSVLTNRISRKDAESKSIDDFITGYLLEQQNKSQDEIESQRRTFDDFKKAWNNMRALVDQQLGQGNKMPRLRATDSIAYCLTESDSGIYLLTAIKILVSLQNSILDEMIFLSTQQRHPALRFLENDGKCSSVSSVSLQHAKKKEIINFRWSDELFQHAQNNLEYGHGEEIIYDFERMEMELAHDVAFGKCHLTGTLNKFIFLNELFHSIGPMLTEIRRLFPKLSSSLPDDIRQGLRNLKERRIDDAQSLLQHVEVLMFLLKLKLKNNDVEMTLETFLDIWTDMLPSPFPVHLLPEPRRSIQLKHLAALYEALEDLLADGAIEGLPDQFQQDLTDEDKDELNSLVDNMNGKIKLQPFLNALRRFVFRYLSSEKFLPEPSTPLSFYLKESSLWLPDKPPDTQVIPNVLTLEYMGSVITHLKDLDEKRKRSSRTGSRTPRGSQTTLRKQDGRRRDLAAKLMRS